MTQMNCPSNSNRLTNPEQQSQNRTVSRRRIEQQPEKNRSYADQQNTSATKTIRTQNKQSNSMTKASKSGA
ncbi:hypothetical protein HYC85_018005 [Camellia sinensis]|uniref:Uncharacterized protein n=1 Tax=Camellia sinensis TaxID=4442 RepID=A0A7J7GWZ3_CAMSI|nr:hypothetical protein HYC85_018005 [Camellia sinensis]